jgi:uncharacterized protein (TIGR02757 family)
MPDKPQLHLKRELDLWYKKNNKASFIEQDPLRFPHFYATTQGCRADIEIAAFLAAAIAWGRRDLILRSAERMFAIMGKSPAAFVMAGDYRTLGKGCIHRTFFEKDLRYFCKGFRAVYRKYGSLEALFAIAGAAGPVDADAGGNNGNGSGGSIWDGIGLFRNEMAKANGGLYTKHIADPASGSACKRINLALRWLVRPGPVDLGLWKSISPSALFIPLDLHVGRAARSLGLLRRKSNDKKAVIELTETLRRYSPQDPVKYDLALFGASIDKFINIRALTGTSAFNIEERQVFQ